MKDLPDDRPRDRSRGERRRRAAAAASDRCYDDEDLDSKRFVLSITRREEVGLRISGESSRQ